MADKKYFRDEDVDIHIIITNADAVVTGVVDNVPTISNAAYVITDEDMIEEQFEIKESICSQDRPIIGSCESNLLEFQMNITDADGIIQTMPDRDDLIKVYMWFDEDSSNIMTVGTYKVNTVNLQNDDNKATITSCDLLYTYRNTDVSEWFYGFWETRETATVKEFTDALLTYLGIERYGALLNQSMPIKKFIDGAEVISAGYLLSLICEANGAFGHLTRDNKFGVIRISASQNNAVTIDEDVRFNPTKRSKYEYTWAPTGVKLLDANGNKLAGYRATKEKPYIIKNNPLLESIDDANKKEALKNIYKAMELWGYAPAKVKTIGDLTVEVGDRIRVNEEADDEDGEDGYFKTFVLERVYRGIYLPYDTYTAKGERDLTQTSSPVVANNFSGGSLEINSSPSSNNTGKYNILNSGLAFDDLPEIIRNFGLRLLNEPTRVDYVVSNNTVAIKWNDPTDITDDAPCPCEWAGTVVVRKLGKAPINRWDGVVVVDSTIHNQYAEDSFIDNVDVDKDYYYGIFPYDTEGHYRYTKTFAINTDYKGEYPKITEFEVNDNYEAIFGISLPSGNWSAIKMVYNADHIPNDIDDGTAINLVNGQTEVKVSGISGRYYFIIFMIDSYGRVITSNEMDVTIPIDTSFKILDYSNSYIHSAYVPSYSANNKQGNGLGPYISYTNSTLSRSGYYNGGKAHLIFKNGFYRGKAKKMYIDATTNLVGSSYQWLMFLLQENDTLVNGYADPYSYGYKWYDIVSPTSGHSGETIRKVYEFDISDIPSDKLVYLALDTCELGFEIHKISFDQAISINKGIFNCYGVDIDTHIARENSKFSGGSYQVNNIIFGSDDKGAYWGNSSLQLSNAYQYSKIGINKSDYDYLCFELECGANSAPNRNAWIVASEIIPNYFLEIYDYYNPNVGKAKVSVVPSSSEAVPLQTFKVDLSQVTTEQFYIGLQTSDCLVKVRRCWLEKGGNS